MDEAVINLAPYIEEQIKIQRRAIKSQQRQVRYLAISGVAIILISLVVDTIIYLKTGQRVAWGLSDFLKLGGTSVGVFSAFPYKDIPPRQALVQNFELVKSSCQDWDKLPSAKHEFCEDLLKMVMGQAIR